MYTYIYILYKRPMQGLCNGRYLPNMASCGLGTSIFSKKKPLGTQMSGLSWTKGSIPRTR